MSAVIISDAEQAVTDSRPPFITLQRSHCAHGKWENLRGSTNIRPRAETEDSTCGVHNVAVGLRSSACFHADAHILSLGQRALGGEVAGHIWRNYCLIWKEEETNKRYHEQGISNSSITLCKVLHIFTIY